MNYKLDIAGDSPVLFGIDPGTNTGVAIWNPTSKRFIAIRTLAIHRAMQMVKDAHLTAVHDFHQLTLVIFEDARQRVWFGKADARQEKYGAGVREGAGAAKRDAAIWEDFLTDEGIPFIARAPQAGMTKVKSEYFQRLSGWTERTSEHARDAGMLVLGIDMPHMKSLLRFEQQVKVKR